MHCYLALVGLMLCTHNAGHFFCQLRCVVDSFRQWFSQTRHCEMKKCAGKRHSSLPWNVCPTSKYECVRHGQAAGRRSNIQTSIKAVSRLFMWHHHRKFQTELGGTSARYFRRRPCVAHPSAKKTPCDIFQLRASSWETKQHTDKHQSSQPFVYITPASQISNGAWWHQRALFSWENVCHASRREENTMWYFSHGQAVGRWSSTHATIRAVSLLLI